MSLCPKINLKDIGPFYQSGHSVVGCVTPTKFRKELPTKSITKECQKYFKSFKN